MKTSKVAQSNVVKFLVFALLGASPLSGCDKSDLDGWNCAADTECLSGYCTDGVCCEERCAQTCMACSAEKKGSGWDGSCEPIAAGADPDGECPEDIACSGNSACTFLSTGTSCSNAQQCLSGQCVDGVCCSTKCSDTCMACSATKKGHGVDGICETIALNTDPDDECLLDCNGVGACILLGPGQPCQSIMDCESRLCEDGVCCADDCHYPCFACTGTKRGWGEDGFCGAIAANLDPDDDCFTACDGFGECILLPNGAACSFYAECMTSNCVDGICCDTACQDPCQSCSAAIKGAGIDGTCGLAAAGTDPQNRCPGNAVCNAVGGCELFVNGAPCTLNGECSSGYCVDGACCNTACLASCMTCNSPGAIGTCIAAQPNMCGPICNDPVVFAEAATLNAPDTTDLVKLADMNGDGKMDLVLRKPLGTNGLEVHLRTGDKTFAQPTEYATDAVDLVTADLNGDGKPDVAAANGSKNTVSVYVNNGNGTLAPKVDYVVAGTPQAIVAIDMNGDGKLDLAVANYDGDSLSVLLNQGNGTLGFNTNYPASNGPLAVVAADVNGDTKPDLATLCSDATIGVYINNGNGTFGARKDYTKTSAQDLTFADVNTDGKPDLVVGANDQLTVFRNLGNGSFAVPMDFPAHINDVVAGDFNGDGKIDIAGTSQRMHAATVLLNTGNGTFGPQYGYGVEGVPAAIAVGDVAGDGRPDLVVASGSSAKVSLLENKGGGRFIARNTSNAGSYATAMFVADLNGDTWEDVVIVDNEDPGVMVFLNDQTGRLIRSSDYALFGSKPVPAVADVDGDGDLDLAVCNLAGSGAFLSVYLNNGDGTFAARVDTSLVNPAERIVALEATGDGKIDMAIVTSGFFSETIRIWNNLGNGQFSAGLEYPLPGHGATVATIDMNSDGLQDLIVGVAFPTIDTLKTSAHVFINQGNGNWAENGDYPLTPFTPRFQTADLTEDGLLDLVNNGSGAAEVNVYVNLGNGTFADKMSFPLPLGISSLAFSDMTGDGYVDMALVDDRAEWASIRTLDATGTFSAQTDYPLAHEYTDTSLVAPAILAAADFNHDGKSDLAIVHPLDKPRQVLEVFFNTSINACFP